MAHPAARCDLDSTPALPDTEAHLKVLTAPDVHPLVVRPGVPEVFSVNAEQSSSHDRRPVRCRHVSFSRLNLVGTHGVPAEVEVPVERTPVEGEGLCVLERVVVDDVDHWANDSGSLLLDSLEQRLKPAWRGLTVCVKEGNHRPLNMKLNDAFVESG